MEDEGMPAHEMNPSSSLAQFARLFVVVAAASAAGLEPASPTFHPGCNNIGAE